MPILRDDNKSILYFSHDTIVDCKVLLLNVKSTIDEIPSSLIGEKELNRFKELRDIRFSEIIEFFENEGILILIIDSDGEAGSISFSNGGRGKKYNIEDLIPVNYPKTTLKKGEIKTAEIDTLFNCLLGYESVFKYSRVIKHSDGKPILRIEGTKYIVGEVQKIKKGYIYILPESDMDISEDYTYENLKEIATKAFSQTQTLNLPEWAKKTYNFEKEDKTEMHLCLKQKEELENKISSLENKINEFQKLKVLFTGSGIPLENIIIKILKEIGYNISTNEKEKNRTDIVIEEDTVSMVFEVKGVKGSAAEKNCSQVLKWKMDYHSKNEKWPKAILIINTYKDTPTNERNQESFPHQMLKLAEDQDVCLITGMEFLSIYFDFLDKKIDRDQIKDMLVKTKGKLSYPINDLLSITN